MDTLTIMYLICISLKLKIQFDLIWTLMYRSSHTFAKTFCLFFPLNFLNFIIVFSALSTLSTFVK